MGLELRLAPKLERRLTLNFVQRIEVPKDWDFTEPEPITPVKYTEGKAYVEIAEDDIVSYARGCRQIAGIVEQEKPSVVLISMRGGKPVSRCVEQFLDDEYSGVEARTSYFLSSLSRKINRALRLCRRNGKFEKMLMLDTSVTGTKLSWFMPQMLGGLSNSIDEPMDFVTAVLWHGRDGWYEESETAYGTIENRNYSIGVRNLICEDNPTLLGAQYDAVGDSCAREARGKTRAYDKPEEASVHVLRGGGRLVYPLELYNGTVRTADLFVMLVKEYAQNELG